jgi:ABC-type antimicrobial peptide transport system permease subunit
LAIPLQETYIRPINGTGLDELILDYDSHYSSILTLLNITGNTVVIPAETNLSILVSLKLEEERFEFEIGNSSHPIKLAKNVKIYLDHPALIQVKSYQRFVNETVEFIKGYLKNIRAKGFYVGLELYRLEYIEKTRSSVSNFSDPMKILAYQQEALANSILINEGIKSTTKEVYAGQIMVSIIATILALSISAILSEKKEQYATFLMITFIIFMTISYQLFPSLHRSMVEPQAVIPWIILLIVMTFLIALLAPYFPEIKSRGDVSLISALFIAISYSIGSLKKRKMRTALALISITLMITAISSLTSISVIFTTNSVVTTRTWPANRVPMSMVTKQSDPFIMEDLGFIGAQREILKISYKVITPVAYSPLDYIGEIPIYGVRGLSPGDPSLDLIKSTTYPESSIEKLFNDSNTVLVSRYLADSTDIDVGMAIVFRGVRLKVVGIFDGKQVDKIKEPDDSSFQPLYFLTGFIYGPEPVPSNLLLITNVYTAQKLGGYISSIYCTFEDNVQAKEVSRRLASLENYSVFAMPSSENIIYYYKGGFKEVFGTTVLVPILITILNIMFLFYTLVYEKKNEIFIFSCVGLNPSHIFSLFLVEAGIMGFIGGSIGYILSMMLFKVFDIFNLIVPVNVKSSPFDMLLIIIVTTLTAILSSSIPAIRAAKISTPSLLRRWKMEEKMIKEGAWSVQLPVRISPEKVEFFTNYLYERLPQSSTVLELSISNLKREERMDDKGYISYTVSFNYERGGNRPFTIRTTIEIKRENGDYVTNVHTKSPYTITLESNVYEVVNHVRKLVIEWSALRLSLAIVMGESIEQALTVVKRYQPRFIQVYSRRDVNQKLSELRRKLRSEGVWPPTIQVKKIETSNIETLVEKLSDDIMSIDAVCLDSDDGLLSSALLIAAMRLNKNLLLFDTEGKPYEMPAKKILENLKH